jgi:hypothetical protein
VARPALLGHVGAGTHAGRREPPAEDRQFRGLEPGKHPPDLPGGVARPPRPKRQLRGLPRAFAGRIDAADVNDAGLDLLPPGGTFDVTAQQADLGAALVHMPVSEVGRPGGQRVDQRRCLGGAPAGEAGVATGAEVAVTGSAGRSASARRSPGCQTPCDGY